MKKKKFIFPEKDHWLTQAVLKVNEIRVFMKALVTDNPEEWVNWTNEQRSEYLKEHRFHND
jgi:hypothetical protein